VKIDDQSKRKSEQIAGKELNTSQVQVSRQKINAGSSLLKQLYGRSQVGP
jgi:hypothetical protein